MTKKDLITVLEKYDDDNEIYFYDKDSTNFLSLEAIEESTSDWILTFKLIVE